MIHTMKSVDLIRELVKAAWTLDRVRGSHHVFRHPSRPGIIVIPHPKKDLGKGLVAKIRKQAGV
jgi:predicted RNA binding protein YcfA (HicA-like mRNA interferase family)